MDKCLICEKSATGVSIEGNHTNGKHFRYTFCNNHSSIISLVYVAGMCDGYNHAKQELNKNLVRIKMKDNIKERKFQKEIEDIRWDLDELKDKLDKE